MNDKENHEVFPPEAEKIFPPAVIKQWSEIGVNLVELMSAGALGKWMGIEAVHAEPSGSQARMPVEGNTQPYGLLHGGATAALCETVGSVSAMLHAGPGKIAVGVDLNITHHRPVMDGFIVANANGIHLGRSTAVYEIVVTTEDEDKRVATARLTTNIMPDPTMQ